MKTQLGILLLMTSLTVADAKERSEGLPSSRGLTAPTETTISPRDYNGTGSLSNSTPTSVSELPQQREEADEDYKRNDIRKERVRPK